MPPRADRPHVLETDIQQGILDYLAVRRIFHYRQNTGAAFFKGSGIASNGDTRSRFIRFGVAGAPDIVAIVNGRYVGIEVKGPRGVQSEAQKEFENRVRTAGGTYILARSIDDVAKQLPP
jgi:hypothetical protein